MTDIEEAAKGGLSVTGTTKSYLFNLIYKTFKFSHSVHVSIVFNFSAERLSIFPLASYSF